MAYIYQIINKLTQKRYIGETLNAEERKERHFSDLRKNSHHSQKLQRAFNKYGKENFEFSIIAEVPDNERFQYEMYYINQYNSWHDGYNETSGGDNPGFEKLQKTVYCYSFEGEYLNEWYVSGREASRALLIDQGLLQKICTGVRKSAFDKNGRRLRFDYQLHDRLEKIDARENSKKPVCQYDKNMNLINVFDSKTDAAVSLGLTANSRGGLIRAIKSGKLYHDSYWREK